MAGAFNRNKNYPNYWERAKASTEEHIGKLLKISEVTGELGTYKLGFIVDTFFIENEDFTGYIKFAPNILYPELKEVGFFKDNIQYKFDEHSVSELVVEPPFGESEYPNFEYRWEKSRFDESKDNLSSLKITLGPLTSLRYRVDENFEKTMIIGTDFGKLPRFLKGEDNLSIKKRGEDIQHPIRWSIDGELTRMSIFYGSKFEEAVDVLYKNSSKPYLEILGVIGDIYRDEHLTKDDREEHFEDIKVLMRDNPKNRELVDYIKQNIYTGNQNK